MRKATGRKTGPVATFFSSSFSDLSDFFPTWEKNTSQTHLCPVSKLDSVTLIYNLQNYWVNSPASAQPAGHSLEQNQRFSREGPARPMPGSRAAAHSCWGRAESCQSHGNVRDLLGLAVLGYAHCSF